ncbi:MAG: hypothetical protein M1824_005818 [Vezdaea acicularis]|nr:MAG: hypothetical protein M1824_005818 [Vezdaea acicularis]
MSSYVSAGGTNSNQLLSYFGWAFLPGLVAGWLQTIYYTVTIRAGDPKPQAGSPRYLKHRQRIHCAVIVVYLLYTIFEADWEIRRAGDYYQALGLTPSTDEKTIKARFRRLTLLHHPDKAVTQAGKEESEAYFVYLRLAHDTLLNPVKRFAYERFGPGIIEWKHCSSNRDFIITGLQRIAPYYAAGGFFMVIMGFLGILQWGVWWRYIVSVALATFEIYTITRPYFPPFVTKILNPLLTSFTTHPPYLPFQLLALARKIALTLFIAFSQLGPLLQKDEHALHQNTEAAQQQQIDRVEQLSRLTDFEAARLLTLDLAPYADEKIMKDFNSKLREWMVQSTIRNTPEVRDALGRVVGRRRPMVPAGARGAR